MLVTRSFRIIPLFFVILTVSLLVGCAQVPSNNAGGNVAEQLEGDPRDEIVLYPGDSSICFSDPCKVYFVLPEGKGEMSVLKQGPGGEGEAGKFAAGSKAEVGSFESGVSVLTVVGSDAPKTWITVIDSK